MANANVNVLEKRSKFKVPNAYVIILGIIVVCAVMTYLVPAGVYDTYKDEVTGRNLVDATSYHHVDSSPVGIAGVFKAIPRGMTGAAGMIFLVFLIGGFFQIINDTGAIDSSINILVKKLKNKEFLVVIIIMALMTVLGALGIIVNAVIAFIPLGIILAKRMKVDPLFGMGLMYLGVYSGTTTTPMGFFNTLLAQNIAGLEPMSGFGFRSVVWGIVWLLTVIYLYRYYKKVKNDNSKSAMGNFSWDDHVVDSNEEAPDYTWRHSVVMIALLAGFTIYAYGSFKLKWRTNELIAIVMAVALLSGVVGKMSPDRMVASFIAGCKAMVFGAIIMGFAKAISIVLSDGQIIHSIIYYMSLPLKNLPSTISATLMFWINTVFNFFVPSGSGQAMIVMPLQAPLADVVGVSRQVAVSAYLYGDGLSNTIIPTSGVLMGALGVANIPWQKWLKFHLPLFGMWMIVATIAIIVGVLVGWS